MRDHAEYLQVAYGSSERRACQVLTLGRSTCRYESVATEQAVLRMRIQGPGGVAGELWIPAHSRAAEEARLEGESQAGLQALASGGTADAAEEAQPPPIRSEGGRAGLWHQDPTNGGPWTSRVTSCSTVGGFGS